MPLLGFYIAAFWLLLSATGLIFFASLRFKKLLKLSRSGLPAKAQVTKIGTPYRRVFTVYYRFTLPSGEEQSGGTGVADTTENEELYHVGSEYEICYQPEKPTFSVLTSALPVLLKKANALRASVIFTQCTISPAILALIWFCVQQAPPSH